MGRDSTTCCPKCTRSRWRVTAPRASAFRVSAVQPSAAGSGFPRLMAEKPKPESLMPAAVTCHLKMSFPWAESGPRHDSAVSGRVSSCLIPYYGNAALLHDLYSRRQ